MTDVPKPLLAALGLLAEVRQLPAHAVSLGLSALSTTQRVRRDYAALITRGERVVGELFGGGETTEEPALPPTPEVALEDEVLAVAEAVAHVEDPLDAPRSGAEPLPGYDAMTLGGLRGRLRSLSPDDLARVLDYERTHLARPPMLTLVEHRIAKLALE